MPIRLLVADDHFLIRDGFRLMFRRHPYIQLVGTAADGGELLLLMPELKPDIVITDIKMPCLDGIAATRRIRRQWPGTGVIGLSMCDEDYLVAEMLLAGAQGYLLKNDDKKTVIGAMETVLAGGYCLSPGLQRQAEKTAGPCPLTQRELQVLWLLCQEKTNTQVAHTLQISLRTVEDYRRQLMQKSGATNVVGLLLYAQQNQLFPHYTQPAG